MSLPAGLPSREDTPCSPPNMITSYHTSDTTLLLSRSFSLLPRGPMKTVVYRPHFTDKKTAGKLNNLPEINHAFRETEINLLHKERTSA